ncbi:MAG TPA: hypothetical protein DCE47_05415 [Planctomycetaceae bacterium]|nr:hypothetical protein [Planctomycetaceae bacterium]
MTERVGFGKRFGASMIDGILGSIGGMILGAVFGGLLGGAVAAEAGAASGEAGAAEVAGALGGIFGAFAGAMVGIAFAGVIIAVWEACTGAAIGKMALGIKIKSADGSPASFGKLLLRSLFKYNAQVLGVITVLTGIEAIESVGNIGMFVVAIGCLLVLGGEKQALHDKLAGTAVYPKDATTAADQIQENLEG